MKIKETKNSNIKLTLNPYELDVIMRVLQHVRLGDGPNSDVIFELQDKLHKLMPHCLDDLDEISVTTEIEDGVVSHTISV